MTVLDIYWTGVVNTDILKCYVGSDSLKWQLTHELRFWLLGSAPTDNTGAGDWTNNSSTSSDVVSTVEGGCITIFGVRSVFVRWCLPSKTTGCIVEYAKFDCCSLPPTRRTPCESINWCRAMRELVDGSTPLERREFSSGPKHCDWDMMTKYVSARATSCTVRADLIGVPDLLRLFTYLMIQLVTRANVLKEEKWSTGTTGSLDSAWTCREISFWSSDGELGGNSASWGQSTGSCFSQTGPRHHNSCSISSSGYNPRDAQSAGFCSPLICLQCFGGAWLRMNEFNSPHRF